MNLSRFYPIIFWNVANLIVDSGAEFTPEDEDEEDVIETEGEEAVDEEEDESGNSTSNYGKIAAAIGKMQKRGVCVLPPDINQSKFTYTPNVEANTILYGLKGIVRIGDSLINEIMANRPYNSMQEFLQKVKTNKTQMVNLIKCGAFDEFGDRRDIMEEYINIISDTKKKLTLQNVATLIEHKLFPDEFDFQCRVFNFNKYLRKFKDKATDLITLDEVAQNFYNKHFDMDLLRVNAETGVTTIYAPAWKTIYDSHMTVLKKYIVDNQFELLNALNSELTAEVREKYAQGSVDKWSMDSVCFYQDKHELDGVDLTPYGVEDFWSLPEEPQIANSFKAKDGHVVNMFKLTRIAGTVIDKNKNKNQITLLTTSGVVIVQAYGVMPQYDKRISMVGEDGKKHVIEKSWFTRGNKIIVNGMRRGENIFVAKKYASQPGHHFMLIKDINDDGTIELQEERFEVAGE